MRSFALILAVGLLIGAGPAQAQTETILYNFTVGSDGYNPQSSLTSDGKGNFYGTTNSGGQGIGIVFELSPNGSGGWKETALYSFPGGADGANPGYSDVIFDSLGNLYGTTYGGGVYGHGTVFELSPAGTNWTETVLYSFAAGTDGGGPLAGVIMDQNGNLYGTTYYGGDGNNGTVFELSLSGGNWTEQVISNLTEIGGQASAGLTMDTSGNIFGTTTDTVFELSPNGNGGWNPTLIHTFAGGPKDGSYATGTPVLDQAGNLYGTTEGGGTKEYGTVYKLSPGKKGKWTEKILHSFKGGTKDGSDPYAGIVFDAFGNIYGTTAIDGKNTHGIVFELAAPVGKGSYKEKILWTFNGSDGWGPLDSLILDSAGNLYGTTTYGGSSETCGDAGCGVVFEVTP